MHQPWRIDISSDRPQNPCRGMYKYQNGDARSNASIRDNEELSAC